MEILWAPWRMEYVAASNEKGECIFCPGNDRSRDEERLILFVVRHVSALDALNDEEKLVLISMVEKAVGILMKAMNPGGFNVGLNLGRIAGAGVEDHIHFHVVPRWSGDTNYMTVMGEVRVIPEHIRATYKKLLPLFHAL